MRYIQYILFPDERILYNGKLHPVLYMPGLTMLGLAMALPYYGPRWLMKFPLLAEYLYIAKSYIPYSGYIMPGLTWLLFGLGILKLLNAMMMILYTELVVTDHRIIIKYGVTTTTTVEMDRHKIAGISVTQTVNGKMFNYGNITLRGFAGQVVSLPAVSNPYGLQRYVNAG